MLCSAYVAMAADNAALPMPSGVQIKADATPTQILDAFLGIPYKADEVVDEHGRWSYFAKPDVLAKSPGLNCSGYTLSAFRFLVNKNITLAESKVDRRGDSGKGSALGEDWDFGWDLIANISEGFTRTVLMPAGKTAAVDDIDPTTERGYNLHETATWQELLPRVKAGHVYLLSFSQESRIKGYKLVHYHAAYMAMGEDGNVWLYHTTGGAGKSYKLNMSSKKGMATFMANFDNKKTKPKYILVLEVKLPE